MPPEMTPARRNARNTWRSSACDGKKTAAANPQTAPAAKTLDCNFVSQARDDDLAAARVLCLVDGEQVALEDAGVAHRQAAHAQQIVSARREEIRIDLVMAGEIFFREDRRARRHASDHRQLKQARRAAA